MPAIDFKFWTGVLADWVELAAAALIGLAVIEAAVRAAWLVAWRNLPPEAKENLRLRLARWLAVALEFELAADILRTAISPSWDEIGKLAAIATIRTLLNYFLEKEIQRAARHESGSPTSGPLATRDAAPSHASEDGRERSPAARSRAAEEGGHEPAPI